MNSIVKYERFDKDGIEIVINKQTGESFATKRGYARMANKDESTIRQRLKGAGEINLKSAQIQTAGGLQGADLIPGKLALTWLAKDNPELLIAMSEVGWNVYCHKLAGYEVKTTAIEKPTLPTNYLEALKELVVQVEENEKLEKQNKMLTDTCVSLKEEIIEKQPLVKLAETLVVNDEKGVTIEDFAKAMKTGRNIMFRKLREINFLQQNGRTPYQTHINLERAEVYRKPRKYQPNIYDTVTVLTGKGQKYIVKKLEELLKKEQTEVVMESYLSTDDF